MDTIGIVEAIMYVSQPTMLLAYTAAAVMCQGLVALILWSTRMAAHQQ